MLSRLASGGEETNSILVISSSADLVASSKLFQLFKKSLSKNQSCCVLTGARPTFVNSEDLDNFAEALDISDPLGWDNSEEYKLFPGAVIEKICDNNDKISKNVVIDSLTDLLVFYKPSQVSRFIRNYRIKAGKNCKLIAILHKDCVSSSVSEDIQKFFNTVITLSDIKKGSVFEKIINTKHFKPGGKLVSQKETFVIDSENKIKIEAYKEENKEILIEEEEEAIDKLTSFSLNTTNEKEKKAKDSLVLPFYKEPQKIGEVKLNNNTSTSDTTTAGKIYYEPDSGDDWDDEDPDDDLDF